MRMPVSKVTIVANVYDLRVADYTRGEVVR